MNRPPVAFFLLAIMMVISESRALAQEPNQKDPQTGLTYEQTVEMNRLSIQSNALLEKNDWVNARPLFEQICKLNPKPSANVAGLHCNLATACMYMGDKKEALREFQIAFAMNPHDASIARGLASYYFVVGDTENGKLWLHKCIDTAQPTESDLISEAKSTLATMSQAGAQPGKGDKNSPDYLSDLFNGKGARWPSDKIPLKIFFVPASSVPHYRKEFKSTLEDAFNEWTAATGGRLSWIEVPTADKADIVCVWKDNPGAAVSEGGRMTPEGGQTSDGTWLFEHATVTLFALSKDPFSPNEELKPMSEEEAQWTCKHEVGHALGMYGHSSNSDDIMFYSLSLKPVTQLSQRDKNTIMRVYQSYPVKMSLSKRF